MDVLLTQAALDRWGDLLTPSSPPARWLVVGSDGTLRIDGEAVDPGSLAPTVGWISNDLFASGGLRSFFDLLQSYPSLEWVHSGAAGVDASIFGDLLTRGVRLSTSHVTAVPIAEYVLGAVIRHYQAPERWADARARRAWEQHSFREIHGTTWLVAGLGAIGTEIALRARAFGAHVIGVRRHPEGGEPVDEMVPPDRLVDTVPRADVVVVALPGTERTHGLVGAAFLGAMRDGSVLVNVGRGSVVDEPALLEALGRGVPEVAILDVFLTEPLPPDHPFWDHPRVVVTPHGAGSGHGRMQRAGESFADNLTRWIAGDPLAHEATVDDLPAGGGTVWHTEVTARTTP